MLFLLFDEGDVFVAMLAGDAVHHLGRLVARGAEPVLKLRDGGNRGDAGEHGAGKGDGGDAGFRDGSHR